MKYLLCLWSVVTVTALWSQEVRLTQVVTGFSSPTDIENANDGSGRLFLVQQSGQIRILRNGAIAPQPFLDISSRVRNNGEQGLLGLAFPPEFARVQRFYVYYTRPDGSNVVAQYRVSGQADLADATSEIVLMTFAKPAPNHNGGQIRFGPDGYLYIGTGDGGGANDQYGNGQNRNSLLAKLLRVDVESAPGQVKIPPSNPFANTANARPEIWAWGLRNPWRFSFDRATNDLWIADVGQDTYEEINFQPARDAGGENYGWSQMEGMHCFRAGCSTAGLTLPVAEYNHTLGCSVTGGFVYRGAASPSLRGLYFYADYCSGRLWTLERQGSNWVNTLALNTGYSITTFGEDEMGELYAANAQNGILYRVDGSQAPRLSSAGVVNAASYAPGLVPGSLATLFAPGLRDAVGVTSVASLPLPLTLQGLSLTINNVRVPLLSLANVNGQEQLNFQVPFDIAGPTAAVIVTRNGAASNAVTVPVLNIQPAIYTRDGATQGIVVHAADYTLVTPDAPLVAGEYAFLYAGGLGPVTNRPAAGAAAPSGPLAEVLTPVQVLLGDTTSDAQFAGLAPGFVGVYQVNFRVPAGVSGTPSLSVRQSGVTSPAVNVPVR